MRSRILSLLLAAASLVALAQPSGAADGRYWSFSPMAGLTNFSNQLFYPADSLKRSPAIGVRIGHVMSDRWGYELGAAYGMAAEASGAERDVTYLNASLSLLYSPVTWSFGSLYFAAGGGYDQYKSDNFDDLHYGTFEQAIGFKAPISPALALRLEARNVLNVPEKNWGEARKADQQYWAGLTFGFGGKPKDTDGDGVADRKDACPDTQAGATVNATGCPSDSDGDGVWDGLDQCTGTPKGATVDAKGCPNDSDGDGVYDGLDQCPNTPKGATVNAQGCPSDSDGDGVWDGLDQCPNTPKGATVNATGCPTDSDNDGIWDGLDKCTDTPAGAKVDADGCPIVVTERETELLDTGMIRLQGVNFETGKSEILAESFPILDEVGTILRRWPQLQIEVGGHTDSRGAADANQSLSEARADAVRSYLLAKFTDIQGGQLTARGYGESKPIAPNKGALNLAKNRRVEFVVLNKDVLKKEVEKRRTLQK